MVVVVVVVVGRVGAVDVDSLPESFGKRSDLVGLLILQKPQWMVGEICVGVHHPLVLLKGRLTKSPAAPW